MDKKLQREVLIYIKNSNYEKGTSYNQIVADIVREFVENKKVSNAKLLNNIRLLGDTGRIEGYFPKDLTYPQGALRITSLGYAEFDPWYKKLGRWFTDDFAKILSVVAIILSILSTIISLWKT